MIGDYIAFLSGFRFFIINFAENIRIKLIFNSNYYNKNQKMKKFFSYFMISLCLLGTSVVTSCSSDDDDKEEGLPELPYLSDAAIYQVDEENNNEEIVYIELTSAGNYFINYVDGAPEGSSVAMKRFECSTFTKNSDGTYQLNGKNVALKIESAGSNKFNITLGDKSYTATKAGTGSKASFANADKICRSWKVKKAYAEIKELTMPEPLKVSADNYKQLTDRLNEQKRVLPYFEELDYISFSNTYKDSSHLWYVGKTDSSIARGVWQWDNGKIKLGDSSKSIDVTFEGSTMKLSHTTVDGSTTIKWEYELTPAPLSVR